MNRNFYLINDEQMKSCMNIDSYEKIVRKKHWHMTNESFCDDTITQDVAL